MKSILKKITITLFTILALISTGCSNKPSEKSAKNVFELTVLKNINTKMVEDSRDYNLIAKPVVDEICKLIDQGIFTVKFGLMVQGFSGRDEEKAKKSTVDALKVLIEAQEMYLNKKIGPFGKGYKIKNFNITNGQKQIDNKGVEIYIMEYDAILEALSEIVEYSLPDTTGIKLNLREATQLEEFLKTFKPPEPPYIPLETRVLPTRGEYRKTGNMKFEKTDKGWKGEDGNVY